MFGRSVAADELRAVARERGLAAAEIGKADAAAKLSRPQASREDRTRLRVEFGDDVGRIRRARAAQNPFHVRGDGNAARRAGIVAQGEPGNLDRVIRRNELNQVSRDTVRAVLKTGVALAMARHIRRILEADWQRGRRPDLSAAFVAQIEGFTGWIDHVVIGPGCDLVLVAVYRPGESRS